MRKRKSRYSKYHDLIAERVSQGIPVSKIADELTDISGDLFFDQGVYAYIARHKLRYVPLGFEGRNKCIECEFCKKYINTNNTEGRICTKSWKTIQPNVRYCPKWCEK